MNESQNETVELTRIIARLNIGGPAIQALTLTRLLEGRGYHTNLVRGVEAPSEGNMDHLARELGVRPTLIPEMRRNPGIQDVVALTRLIRILRQDRPQLVHTHAAKAGTLGRIAALIAFPRRSSRPILVHTFHGHSLTGYFAGRTAMFYRAVERVLAWWTDRLVAVSPEVRDDLIALQVAPSGKFEVIPLGFDLSPFTDDEQRAQRRADLRREWAIGEQAEVVTLVARLVPIKRVDRFLRVAQRLSGRPEIRFVIVGDGELRDQLQSSPAARALAEQLIWAGFRLDIPEVCIASDIVMLTSDNEGTPVSLIEAQAAGIPVVATDVGGVRSAVLDGQTGLLAAPDDEAGLADAVELLLDHPQRAASLGQHGRAHATTHHGRERLLDDHDRLYRRLLQERGRRGGG